MSVCAALVSEESAHTQRLTKRGKRSDAMKQLIKIAFVGKKRWPSLAGRLRLLSLGLSARRHAAPWPPILITSF